MKRRSCHLHRICLWGSALTTMVVCAIVPHAIEQWTSPKTSAAELSLLFIFGTFQLLAWYTAPPNEWRYARTLFTGVLIGSTASLLPVVHAIMEDWRWTAGFMSVFLLNGYRCDRKACGWDVL